MLRTCWLTHMLPETSTQNTQIDSSTPPQLVAVVAGAGFSIYVTSASFGISSGRMSTTFCSSQNSQHHICAHETPGSKPLQYTNSTDCLLDPAHCRLILATGCCSSFTLTASSKLWTTAGKIIRTVLTDVTIADIYERFFRCTKAQFILILVFWTFSYLRPVGFVVSFSILCTGIFSCL